MIDRTLKLLLLIAAMLISLLIIYFIKNYYDLKKFKSCYDINFQDNACTKYLYY